MVDVDGLADSLTDDQLQEWLAVSIIDGWHNGWTQTGEVLASLHNTANRIEIANSADPKATHRASEWKSGHEIVKQLTTFGKRKRRRKMTSVQQLFKRLENGNHHNSQPKL